MNNYLIHQTISLLFCLAFLLMGCVPPDSSTDPLAPEPGQAAFKGIELYSWQDENGEWLYAILVGTNSEKSWAGVQARALDLSAVKEVISEMPLGESISWRNVVYDADANESITLPVPPDDIVQEIKAVALSRQIELYVPIDFSRDSESFVIPSPSDGESEPTTEEMYQPSDSE